MLERSCRSCVIEFPAVHYRISRHDSADDTAGCRDVAIQSACKSGKNINPAIIHEKQLYKSSSC